MSHVIRYIEKCIAICALNLLNPPIKKKRKYNYHNRKYYNLSQGAEWKYEWF